MRGKERIVNAAAEAFGLPEESLASTVKVTVTAPGRVLVENHKGLKLYGEECIEIDGGKELIRLHGDQMQLRYMTAQELLITGKLYTVDIE